MKNIKTFMAIVVLALLLTSCGESSEETEANTQTGETNTESSAKVEEETEETALSVKVAEGTETESSEKIEEGNTVSVNAVEERTNSGNLNTNNTPTMAKTEVHKGDQVAVSYTGTLENGEIFDATNKHDGEPLEFVVGARKVIPGFDDGVLGMKLGEKKTIEMEPKDAYGEYDETKKQIIGLTEKDKKAFEEAGVKLEKGSEFPTMNGPLPIAEVTDNSITVDMNHPLAGKKLIFEVEMLEIK